MDKTLDGHYVIGERYEEIGVLIDLITCLEGARGHNETCESKCGCVQLFGSLKNRSICGYIEKFKTNQMDEPRFEKLN